MRNQFDFLDNWDLLADDEEIPDLDEMLAIALEAGDMGLFDELSQIDHFQRLGML